MTVDGCVAECNLAHVSILQYSTETAGGALCRSNIDPSRMLNFGNFTANWIALKTC